MVHLHGKWNSNPIRSMYGIYANIGCILMVNVTIYSIHGSYGNGWWYRVPPWLRKPPWLNSLNEASTDRAISQPRHTHWLTLACRSSLVASTAWGKKHDLGYSIRCHNDPLYTPMNMYEYNMYIYIYIKPTNISLGGPPCVVCCLNRLSSPIISIAKQHLLIRSHPWCLHVWELKIIPRVSW